MVSDGRNGLLFEPANPADLAAKVEYVIRYPGILSKFREGMPEVKGIEENAKELEEVYSRLL